MTDFAPSTSGWRPPPRLDAGVPDYGQDAPAFLAQTFGFAAATALGAAVTWLVRIGGRRLPFVSPVLTVASGAAALLGASLVAYSRRGKLAHRDRLLGLVSWTGAERVLDIGTGGGLLLIGAAKKLTTGKAVGVDVWRQDDLTHNTRESAMRNAFFEGVADKIEIRYEDARKLQTCTRNSFDVVFANLVLHNIEDPADRASACNEIARVLKPGGTAIVSDYTGTGEVKRALAASGLTIERDSLDVLQTLTYMRTVVAVKPASAAT